MRRVPRPLRAALPLLAGVPLLAALVGAAGAEPARPGKPDLPTQARAVLAKHCVSCHGTAQQAGGLRLDSRAAVLAGGGSGQPAIVPGSSAGSRLIRLVTGTRPGERMPPQGPRLSPAEVATLRRWIDDGAAWPETKAAPAAAAKKWWAFRPLQVVKPPVPKRSGWAVNAVDRFLLAAQEAKGLSPTPPVDRRRLIRRLYFDLTGLPPTPEEVEAFVADPAPDAYEKRVDRLLASPHFGERWARHWLDVARYADSNGQEGDQDRPTAYHYRDFVIRAFNDDLPYDTFVKWQLAGDEYEPDNPLALSATGFITAGPHTVLNVPMEEEKIRNRLNELDDQLSTTGSAFLALTVGCARCHDHKFDPIPTRDYYRLQAAFNGGDRAEVPLLPREELARRREAERAWNDRLKGARQELEGWRAEKLKPLEARVRKAKIDALPIDDPDKALLLRDPESPRAKELAKQQARRLQVDDRDYHPLLTRPDRERLEALTAAVTRFEGQKPEPVPTALAMADFGPTPRETWLLDRGDLRLKKERVELGFLSALTSKSAAEYWTAARAAGTRADTTYQRRALAEWMTDLDHGAGALLARVIVNRLWQHHFGEGLVRTVNDFGLQGEPPSHPELLEWLASELVRGGWKLKRIHRMLVTSAAYRQGTELDVRKAKIDPENRLLWRRRPHRLEAEIYRDAMLAVSGTLNPEAFGPAVRPPIPAEAIQARNLKDPYPANLKDTPETRRRSLYLFHKRVVQYPFLQVFDAPDAAASCGRRSVTTVAPQALAVLNEPFVRLRAIELGERLLQEAGEAPRAQVDRAYHHALGRAPSPAELEASAAFLRAQEARRRGRGETPEEAKRLALADFAQVIFGLNEFVYVD
ncbi:MAG: PSD1 and planctomycete cytochrome C domain-containing protein [Armatimonadota bacterium]